MSNTGWTKTEFNSIFTRKFDLPAGTGDGMYTLRVAAGAIRDVQGRPVEALTATFTLDSTPPTVVATTPADGAPVDHGHVVATVTFSEPLDAAALDEGDFQLVDHVGDTYAPAAWSYDTNADTLTVEYASLPEALFSLVLYGGADQVADVAGNGFGSGEGGVALTFVTDVGAIAALDPMAAAPLGAYAAYEASSRHGARSPRNPRS